MTPGHIDCFEAIAVELQWVKAGPLDLGFCSFWFFFFCTNVQKKCRGISCETRLRFKRKIGQMCCRICSLVRIFFTNHSLKVFNFCPRTYLWSFKVEKTGQNITKILEGNNEVLGQKVIRSRHPWYAVFFILQKQFLSAAVINFKSMDLGVFFQHFWVSGVIITAHAHKGGVFLILLNKLSQVT